MKRNRIGGIFLLLTLVGISGVFLLTQLETCPPTLN